MTESDDLRVFIRDLMTRFDRKTEAWERGLISQHEETMAELARQKEKLDEIIAEGRAGRQALFHLLDRLNGQGGAEPA